MEKKSKTLLKKLEHIYHEIGYTVRYEKGNFTSGSCVLHGKRVIVVNKHFTPEGKLACLTDILQNFVIEEKLALTAENLAVLNEIKELNE